jgi:uncharacterized protein
MIRDGSTWSWVHDAWARRRPCTRRVRQLIQTAMSPERLWWLRIDHPVLLRESLGDLVRHVVEVSGSRPGHEGVLLLDELVYADQWDRWLKTFYDDRWPVRLVATSSATAAPRAGRVESGVGPVVRAFPDAIPVQ